MIEAPAGRVDRQRFPCREHGAVAEAAGEDDNRRRRGARFVGALGCCTESAARRRVGQRRLGEVGRGRKDVGDEPRIPTFVTTATCGAAQFGVPAPAAQAHTAPKAAASAAARATRVPRLPYRPMGGRG